MKIHPWGTCNDAGRERYTQLSQLQAKGITKPAAGTFSGKHNLSGEIPGGEQKPVCFECVVERGREGMLGREPVRNA